MGHENAVPLALASWLLGLGRIQSGMESEDKAGEVLRMARSSRDDIAQG